MRQVFKSKFKVTQTFGNKLIIDGKDYYMQFGLRGHEGLDLVPTGIIYDILCLDDGVAVKDEDIIRNNYGINCTIWHPSIRKATQYCHLKENYISLGQRIQKGNKIGLMGATGKTFGAHLHLNLFEVDENGYRLNKNNGYLGGINPLPFLEEELINESIIELDQCKLQLETEIKNKNETYQELTEVKTNLKDLNEIHSKFLIELADKLTRPEKPVNPDISSIKGAVEGLITVEDQLRKKEKELFDTEKKYPKELKELENKQYVFRESLVRQLRESIEVHDESESGVLGVLGNLGEANKKAVKDLAECQKSQKFDPFLKLFGIYICKLKNVSK